MSALVLAESHRRRFVLGHSLVVCPDHDRMPSELMAVIAAAAASAEARRELDEDDANPSR